MAMPALLKRVDLIDLAIVTVLLVSSVAVSRSPVRPRELGDRYFHYEAVAIAAAVKTGDFSKVQPFEHAPGPSLYYAVPYLLVPVGSPDRQFWRAAITWNFCWTAFALLLIRRAARRLGSAAAGITAAALPIACAMVVYYGLGVLSEPAAYVFVAVTVYGWSLWRTRKNPGWRPNWWVAAGIVGMVACRPNSILMVPLLGLPALILYLRRDGEHRQQGRTALASFAAVSCCLLVISLSVNAWNRAAGYDGQGRFLTHVLIQGAYQFRTEPWDWRHWQRSVRSDSADYLAYAKTRTMLNEEAARTGVPVSSLEARWLRNSFLSEPFTWLRMGIMRVIAGHIFLVNSKKPSEFSMLGFRGTAAYVAFHAALNAVQLFMIFAAVAYFVVDRRELLLDWGLWGPWLALIVFTAATYCEPRYLFPAQPALAVASALLLDGTIFARRPKPAG